MRTVYPPSPGGSSDQGVLSVVLEDDEAVSWAWATSPEGHEYVCGYTIHKVASLEAKIASIAALLPVCR